MLLRITGFLEGTIDKTSETILLKLKKKFLMKQPQNCFHP